MLLCNLKYIIITLLNKSNHLAELANSQPAEQRPHTTGNET